jgi:hypothetical protein
MSKTSETGALEHLHIFVNRQKFFGDAGVKLKMTGAEIAALVGVPTEKAVVRLEKGKEHDEIAVTDTVAIKNGQHFIVTRRVVEGGCRV